jgi:hypothetical protein
MAFPLTIHLGYGQEKVETSSQKQKLGTRAVLPDGRVFYYAENSNAAITSAGQIVDGIAAVGAHDGDLATAALAAGSTTVTTTTSLTVTKDQYKDGYLFVNDVAGQGEVYRVKSNTAVSSAAGCEITLDESDGIRTAFTTGTQFGLMYSPYKDVKIIDGDGTMTTGALGVTTIPVTADYFCWVQTAGPAAVLSGAATYVVGDAIGTSQASGESGAADLWDVSSEEDTRAIGTSMGVVSVDTEYGWVMLSIRN